MRAELLGAGELKMEHPPILKLNRATSAKARALGDLDAALCPFTRNSGARMGPPKGPLFHGSADCMDVSRTFYPTLCGNIRMGENARCSGRKGEVLRLLLGSLGVQPQPASPSFPQRTRNGWGPQKRRGLGARSGFRLRAPAPHPSTQRPQTAQYGALRVDFRNCERNFVDKKANKW